MRADPPSVTVVIPTRNRLTYLREAVRSVKDQTMDDWELVVVDDHSDDGTRDWLESVDLSRLRVATLERHGERAATRNLGLEMAAGASILFLDDDDRLRPQALEVLSIELERERDAVASVGGMVRFDERGPFKTGAHVRRRTKRDVWPDVVVGWVGTPGRTLFRTQAVRDAGGFDQGMVPVEDWELWFRLARRAPAVLLPKVVLEYRVHPQQWTDPGWPDRRRRYIEERLGEMAGDRAVRARRVLAAWELHREGAEALRGGDPRAASTRFLRAVRLGRSIYASPLQRRRLREPLVKAWLAAPLGKRGLRAVRRIFGGLRKARR